MTQRMCRVNSVQFKISLELSEIRQKMEPTIDLVKNLADIACHVCSADYTTFLTESTNSRDLQHGLHVTWTTRSRTQ
jgi:hypothetical protein